ncbi:UNVERIFIED_CONTAM: hypothetical protein FKN15_014460 [Acipenser sinensis]
MGGRRGKEKEKQQPQQQLNKRWWSRGPSKFGPPDWAAEQEQWRKEGAPMCGACGEFGHVMEDCPYGDPQYEEVWNQGLVGDAAEWFWAVDQTRPSPAPQREEPERPAPEREEPERPAPEREEPERPAPEREEPERPAPEREEPERPAPEREEPERPAPEREEPERPAPEREEPERPAPEREEPERRLRSQKGRKPCRLRSQKGRKPCRLRSQKGRKPCRLRSQKGRNPCRLRSQKGRSPCHLHHQHHRLHYPHKYEERSKSYLYLQPHQQREDAFTDQAFVTLATSDVYFQGALVLGHSLRHHRTSRQLVILTTPQVSSFMRKSSEKEIDSRDAAHLALMKRPELGITFTKLHCWALIKYTKCVFLDADTLVLCNVDELFDREEISAAPDPGWPDCFNTGVFVFRPSLQTYNRLFQFAVEHGSFDGPPCSYLQSYSVSGPRSSGLSTGQSTEVAGVRSWMFAVLLLLCSIEYLRASDHTDARPNFIVMMVDDLGIGDIGCYGNSTVRTPNIDRLAQEGVKLTQHIAAGPVCTPSRAAFMTGRYPIRSGKWHLGVNCDSRNDNCHHPVNHGFDYFYGLPFTLFNDCKPGEGTDILADLQTLFRQASQVLGLALLTLLIARLTGFFLVSWKLIVLLTITVLVGFCSWYVPFALVQTWNCIIMKNQDVIEQPMTLETLPQRLLNEAEYFIERNQQRPFFLFFSFAHVHTPLFTSKDFMGKSQHGLYGDNVEEVDWMVGRITNVVERLGLSNKTMMYFTSDHGGHLEDSDSRGQKGGWNGIYKGGKGMGGWEGGIRVPGIFRWPGTLSPGSVIDEPTSLMDVFPTLVNLAGGELPKDSYAVVFYARDD